MVRSSQKKPRQKSTEHRGANDALPGAHRAALLSSGRRGIRRDGDTGTAPGHGLVLLGEVDGRGRVGSGEVSVEAGGNEYGTAARADGGRVRRREGHVVICVERAWDIACQVRQWDIGRGDVEICVVRRVGNE